MTAFFNSIAILFDDILNIPEGNAIAFDVLVTRADQYFLDPAIYTYIIYLSNKCRNEHGSVNLKKNNSLPNRDGSFSLIASIYILFSLGNIFVLPKNSSSSYSNIVVSDNCFKVDGKLPSINFKWQ